MDVKVKYIRGPKKQICYKPRAGLVQCLLKHIKMIAHNLLNQDLTPGLDWLIAIVDGGGGGGDHDC